MIMKKLIIDKNETNVTKFGFINKHNSVLIKSANLKIIMTNNGGSQPFFLC